MKFFRIKLDIGIAGGVVADHYVVSDWSAPVLLSG